MTGDLGTDTERLFLVVHQDQKGIEEVTKEIINLHRTLLNCSRVFPARVDWSFLFSIVIPGMLHRAAGREGGGISPSTLSGQEHVPLLEAELCCGIGKLIINF